MAEGTKTFHGLAVPLLGESEIQQQTAATDILSLTGASAMSGDFVVLQDSSGTELFVVGAKGEISGKIVSSAATSFISLALGSTGAVTNFLAVSTTTAPSYFLSIASSGAGAADNGFWDTAVRYLAAPSTALTYGALKIISGTKAYYILAVPDTGVAVT
jgi:hypothetical protein